MTALLEGRRVLVTGASRGVGRAVVAALLDAGAEVLGSARDAARLRALEEELGARGRLSTVAADLADPSAPGLLAKAVEERWGALDVLLSNAGVMLSHAATLEEEPAGTLEETLAVNLLAPHALVLALLPALRAGREPRVVHVSSGAGQLAALAEPGIGSYRVSKWALNGLVQVQAAQLAGVVAVNALDPGWVRTDLGGPQAPGTPEESVLGALALLREPFEVSGRFFKDGSEIPF